MPHQHNPIGPEWINPFPTEQKRSPARKWIIIFLIACVTLVSIGCGAFVVRSVSFQQLFGLNSATPAPPATRFADLPAGEAVRLGRGRVVQVAYAPDNQTLAVASSLGVWLYRLNPPDDGRLLPAATWVQSIDWSPDSQRLAVGTLGNVFIWSANDGRTLQTIALPEGMALASRVRWSPDGNFIAANVLMVDRAETRIWSAATGQLVHTLSHATSSDSISWSPDSRQLAVAVENDVQIWMVATEHMSHTFHGRAAAITSVVWSPDGSKIATRSFDSTSLNEIVHLWAASDGRLLITIKANPSDVTTLAWSPDGSQVVTIGDDAIVRAWSASDVHALSTFAGKLQGADTVSWSPDQQQIATAGGFGSDVRIWSARDGHLIHTFGGYTYWIQSVRWSPDGQFVAAGAQDRRVWLWSAHDGQLIRIFGSGHREASRMRISWSPDGRYLAMSGDSIEAFQIWSVADGRLVRSLTGTKAGVNSISYAPNGQYVAAGLADGTICIWLAADGRLVQTLASNARGITSINWAPDGTQIAAGTSEGQILIWNIAEARIGQTLEADQMDSVHSVSWSPDGTMIAAGSTDEQRGFKLTYTGTVRVWTVADSKLISMIQAEGRDLSMADSAVQSISWSPDSSMLVSDYGGEVRLSNAESGQIISLLDGHTAIVEAVDWSPDGTRIASGSSDGTIVLWNVKSGVSK